MTISLADAVKMYPSIKLATIRKVVIFSQENDQSNQEENQPMILVHLIWDDIHLGLLRKVLMKEQYDIRPGPTVH